MKKLILGLATGILLAATPAMAQDHNNHHDRATAQEHHSNHHATSHDRRSTPNRAVEKRRVRHQVHKEVRHRVERKVHRQVHRKVRHQVHRKVRNQVQRREIIHRLRRARRAIHRYHYGFYRRPHGWYRHHWIYGEHLPRAWFARNYWINNYVTFGLIAPPSGFVWVREGDNAILVDLDTGEVVRVVYGIFY